MDMNLDSLKKLPLKMKALLIVLICLLLGYFYYMFFFGEILTKKMALDARLTDMQQQITEKERFVAKLDQYVREVNSLKEYFRLALLKLPNEREIAGLLASVVLAGEEAHINFLLFQPPPEAKTPPPTDVKAKPGETAEPEKFYEEIPVKVQIEGTFHNTVSFFSKVAKLPRIINIEDIAMTDPKDVKGKGRIIRTSCTVKTYMFVDKKS